MGLSSWVGGVSRSVRRSLGRPELSVSIVTRDSASRLAGVIGRARRLAEEVVVGVDDGSQDETWAVAADLADAAYRFRHPGQLAPAHMLPFQYCRGRWILRLDDDESMEDGFRLLRPELLATTYFTHYLFPRKWVVSLEPPRYIHESPWYPNWQPRLIRNDASIVFKPPRYHSGYRIAGPGAQEARCALLHYEPIVCSPEMRAEKIRKYREGGGDGVAEDEYAEKVGELRPFDPPREGRARRPFRRRIDAAVKTLEVVPYPPWGCEFLEVDVPRRVRASAKVIVRLRIKNTGRMTWVPYQAAVWPRLTIGIHVKLASGEMLEANGPRIELRALVPPGRTIEVAGFFTAPDEAGEYVLVWDMVSEFECWFEQCGSRPLDTPLTVESADDLDVAPAVRREGARTPFFVVGCPRSGTTLLAVLLDRHSRLSVSPETAFFDELAPHVVAGDASGLRELLCSWRRLDELGVDPEAVVQRVAGRAWTAADVLAALLGLYGEARGKVQFGEKTPQHLRHARAILRQFPGARMLCVLRDGRDVALSLDAMPWWRPRDLADAAELWRKSLRQMEAAAAHHADRFQVVRYEDLVARPEEVVASATVFLGETFEPRQLSSDVQSDVVVPRSMEWKGRAVCPIESRPPEGTRAERATPETLAALDRLLKDDRHRYGYL